MPALFTSTSGAAPSTVTDSSRLPTVRTTLITGDARHLQDDAGLDVGAESLQRHLQSIRARSARFDSMYGAAPSVTSLRVKPVSVCVAVTVTPGSTAPLSSVTRPLNCAVDSCANATVLVRRRPNSSETQLPERAPHELLLAIPSDAA